MNMTTRTEIMEFIIISMGENGLVLVRDTEKYESGKRNWEVVFLTPRCKNMEPLKLAFSSE